MQIIIIIICICKMLALFSWKQDSTYWRIVCCRRPTCADTGYAIRGGLNLRKKSAGNGFRKSYRVGRDTGKQLFDDRSTQSGRSEYERFAEIVFHAVVAGTADALGVQFLPELAGCQGAFVYGLPDLPFCYRITNTNIHLMASSILRLVSNTNNRTNENHLQQIFILT